MPGIGLRQFGLEITRALVVLAVVFLSFAHAPAANARSGTVLAVSTGFSQCGDLPDGDGAGHAPCHACRLGAAADVPTPAGVYQRVRAFVEACYFTAVAPLPPPAPIAPARARGPPALA